MNSSEGNIFWSGINPSSISGPKSSMQSQAAYLGRITNNVVEATVRTELEVEDANGFMTAPKVNHCFDIIAPLLGYKQFTLFCVSQIIGVEFPLSFYSNYWDKKESCECVNMEGFNNCLKEILSSSKTAELINDIIAQSK